MRPLPLLLPCCLALAACTGDVLLGPTCERPDCEPAGSITGEEHHWPVLPIPVGPCAAQYATMLSSVPARGELDRCELFTLDAFSVPRDGVYITDVEVLMTPESHHVDVRLAPSIPGMFDGEVPCDLLWAQQVQWLPVLAAWGERDSWSFEAAPLGVTSRHRLLISHHYINTQNSEASRVGVKLNVLCTDEEPEVSSQSFAFEQREPIEIGPGQGATVNGEGTFDQPVRVTLLFRRTHLKVERFLVERVGVDGTRVPVWTNTTSAWKYEPRGGIDLRAGEGFAWSCSYENQGDSVLSLGGTSSDTCALLGVYQLRAP